MLEPIKIKIYEKLNNFKVIIQDFPLIINVTFNIAFAIKSRALAKLHLIVHNMNLSKISLKSKILDGFAIIIEKGRFSLVNSVRLSAKTKEFLYGKLKISNSIKNKVDDTKLKTLQKTKATSKISGINLKLDPDGYIIGKPATLGYWDDYKLSDMDDLTMIEVSVIEDLG